MSAQILIVILAAIVVLGTIGFVAVGARSRRRPRPVPPPSRPATPSVTAPAVRGPKSDAKPDAKSVEVGTEVAEDVVSEPESGDPDGSDAGNLDVEVLERPRFRDRLGKARGLLAGYLSSIRSRGVDAETWEELEEALIRADVGVEQTNSILDEVRSIASAKQITESGPLLDELKGVIRSRIKGADRSLRFDEGTTNVWLFVGVNGVGKTTTVGKVGYQQSSAGRTVLMAAGDTFRAAAAEQLETWANRSGAVFVRGDEGADPSSVLFDGIQKAAAQKIDLVLGDTAGRLHTKTNLMDELRKVRRVADKDPGNVTEVLLVLDAVTGQNGLVQASQFAEATDVTGVVLTKLDGSAKGGIVLAIESQLNIPVKLVGLGEQIQDLVPFDPDEFVDALFAE